MAQRNIVVSAYLSPDTEMRCLQSLLNFMPVTISVKNKEYGHPEVPAKLLFQQWQGEVGWLEGRGRQI